MLAAILGPDDVADVTGDGVSATEGSPVHADTADERGQPPAEDPPEQSEPEPAPEPEPEPDPEPTPEPERDTFDVATFDGAGDDIIDVPTTEDFPLVTEIRHEGASNFAITSYDLDGRRVDLMVNVIGDFQGTVPYNFQTAIAELEINADGPWSVTISDLRDQPTLSATNSGSGDAVLLHDATGGRLSLTHDGDSNFAVLGWGDRRQLLVNEIGSYDGTVRMAPAVALQISADGNWTIALD